MCSTSCCTWQSDQSFHDAEALLLSRLGSVVSEPMNPFSDPQFVTQYIEGPPRAVPGYEGMQRMTTLLLEIGRAHV